MTTIPAISSSAQDLLTGGFSTLNRAAAQFASLNTESPAPTLNAPSQDPLLGGIIDLTSAREEVSAGVALLNASSNMNQQLIRVTDPYDPTHANRHAFDRYA